ncbi:MAG: ABC transporter permease [Acidimicrobiia bacterium]|jgi:cell division transport system permease protein|nr:ABC transporter permease [Actinomycetota bacterium]NDE57905.1 ABC transporter permease [Acidimicrobiia bacterium]NDD96097.1 ABC transporter permease [Actinomycetota bacterium]NDE79715.1 ABC transporter permease [Actinomycetota bacterium]NDF30973.1 ABC transporter permease [Acidimicrobiia bacterium]
MLARVSYAFRETWASFKRNVTLTAAAVVTSAVSLLLVGSTFLIQRAFDNLLTRWKGDVELIVYVRSDASAEQIAFIQEAIESQPGIIDVSKLRYLDQAESYAEAQKLFAGDPGTLRLLTPENIPSQFKVVPTTDDSNLIRELGESFRGIEGVREVAYAQDVFDVVSRVSQFIRVATTVMSIVLLIVAIGLIWNTIRTAMFARRREIEVMKLVGATNWFIRIPFMLEGLLQGLIGGVLSCAGLWGLNSAWSNAVTDFNDTELAALVVSDGYVRWVMIMLLVIGAAAGAIGSGIAASRFLDV